MSGGSSYDLIEGAEPDVTGLDLTIEELLAGAVAADAPPAPLHVPVDALTETAFAAALGVGRRSLLARGLARVVDGADEIDALLADALLTAGSPDALVVVWQATGEERRFSTVAVGADHLVVLTALEPGLTRLRLLSPAATGACLRLLAGLDGATGVAGPDFVVDLTQLVGAAGAIGDDAEPEDVAARPEVISALHAAVEQLPDGIDPTAAGVSVTTVVVSVIGAGEQPATSTMTWLVTDDDRWISLELDPRTNRLTGAGCAPARVADWMESNMVAPGEEPT